MIKFTTNLDDVVKQVNTFLKKKEREMQYATRVATRAAGKIVKDEIIQSIKDEQAVASGALLSSVSVSAMSTSTTGYEMTVGSSSPYAKYVEEGTPAGKRPSTSAIYKWMMQKGLDASEHGAYLISKSIGERGIPAKRPFEKGANKAKDRIDREVSLVFKTSIKKD